MAKNSEIEAKIILPQKTYQQLCDNFTIKSNFDQENYYFDTADSSLKNMQISCRIRIFNNYAEQTLKIPSKIAKQTNFHAATELTDTLTLTEAQEMINSGQQHIPVTFGKTGGHFLIEHLGQNCELYLQTFSKTHRILAYGPKNCELTFDDTVYPDGYEDYELEIENPKISLISDVLNLLKKEYVIKQSPANTNQAKIKRAFEHRARI
ncbi:MULTISPECIES: CYTH domain-containing protein [unclassified Lactobacillus]|uniref:CYTH domain-containing protein n=1 Tax=unclassified Lactobacillus TaxID=2620435 RepID=UPI000EFBC9D8|nr:MULTISPECIES: CYTH domain-containing protein [unclassified Lactobacillus]RMC40754.1 CYTH domain-containing protein [Lactobacillus sp. ESL0237]RMC44510.1 CYTH domain-containing protein [Lactobacillus sp. ESL0234]RMC45817.1 CYTH domain-containing protein [Lactobacillus sp. ESL0236]RMC51207.1 CYTH domain-containing protein [Lactobacillus sp. ESL0225]